MLVVLVGAAEGFPLVLVVLVGAAEGFHLVLAGSPGSALLVLVGLAVRSRGWSSP